MEKKRVLPSWATKNINSSACKLYVPRYIIVRRQIHNMLNNPFDNKPQIGG